MEKLLALREPSVPVPEWRRRILTVGLVLLIDLSIQHELQEPLDLNGDMFQDIVERDIVRITSEFEFTLRAMWLSTKPKWLSHKKYWDPSAFRAWQKDFVSHHTILDRTYRPPATLRVNQRSVARPSIPIHNPTSSTGVPTKHPRSDDDEDAPVPKRRGVSRSLRPRGLAGPQKAQAVAVPARKIVASGKGWVQIEMDEDTA
ncbi:hypothetical protein B0H16DRAFT_1744253 [Mycena metata]|uniref:Uncharacterized protein n=1 Tax=Mycena metata TaxID=1033252 RepID=A0AAD7H589_9AGAR|nr:hypothetical protein B0H16DRAFT_1744253 [Mycena metata]